MYVVIGDYQNDNLEPRSYAGRVVTTHVSAADANRSLTRIKVDDYRNRHHPRNHGLLAVAEILGSPVWPGEEVMRQKIRPVFVDV